MSPLRRYTIKFLNHSMLHSFSVRARRRASSKSARMIANRRRGFIAFPPAAF
ncbi:hypothetical protein ACZ87_02760 [Candidatus Erwinia dacicola]|uniref:Uncharacterized protein n=1 Tax=Candidatus Erwinia dacicola TaxID=252393 RepID=A0A328TRS5_9GAMM|nr:hypothetical protein ACZ87_02760 [Candidatus Erwinia dacicola]